MDGGNCTTSLAQAAGNDIFLRCCPFTRAARLSWSLEPRTGSSKTGVVVVVKYRPTQRTTVNTADGVKLRATATAYAATDIDAS